MSLSNEPKAPETPSPRALGDSELWMSAELLRRSGREGAQRCWRVESQSRGGLASWRMQRRAAVV
eukprot:2549930-Prorocentrum_lima.AAC.1